MKREVDLIIFDLDGTLIDSKVDIVNSVNHMLRAFGLPQMDAAQITGFIGSGLKQLITSSIGKEAISLEEAMEVYKDIYRVHMFDTTTLYPDARRTLEYFKDKKKVVMSNKNAEFTNAILKKLDIENYFLKVSGGDDENCRKPSACPVLNLLQEFKVQPLKAVIVGDSTVDITAGRDAGILTCGVTYGIGKKEDVIALGPDFIIDNIGKLKDVIG